MADENNSALELNKITVNGYEFEVTDSDARSDIGNISDAIVINNASISSRINDLNGRLTTIENTEYATKEELIDDEYVTSEALNDLNERLEVLESGSGSGSGSNIDAYTKTESDEKYASKEDVIDNEEVIASSISQINDQMTDNELLNAIALNDLTARINSLEDEIESGNIGGAGAQGPQGAQGSAGSNGVQGPQGPQGAKGSNGSNGSQGPQGDAGTQGPQGTQGDSRIPAYTSSDNGKLLMVVNGQLTFVSPVHLYAGTAQPSNVDGYDGDLFIQITE